MTQFVEIPASKFSLARRKLIKGVGANDADYMVKSLINGKATYCPYYTAWSSMIDRCYGAKLQKRCPTYEGCSVDESWLTFSSFRSWMENQDWRGKQLDKDILVIGNKVYSPVTCIFVSASINNIMLGNAARRGAHPQGVCLETWSGRYLASCHVNGKHKNLGRFNTVSEAEIAYLKFKSRVITDVVLDSEASENQKLQSALLRHAKLFMDKAAHIENRMNNKIQ